MQLFTDTFADACDDLWKDASDKESLATVETELAAAHAALDELLGSIAKTIDTSSVASKSRASSSAADTPLASATAAADAAPSVKAAAANVAATARSGGAIKLFVDKEKSGWPKDMTFVLVKEHSRIFFIIITVIFFCTN